jgi:hypothetical protein
MRPYQTIKPPDDIEEDIRALRKRLNLKRSEIVKTALQEFSRELGSGEETKPYDRVANVIETVSSGIPDLGEAHRKYLLKKLGIYPK